MIQQRLLSVLAALAAVLCAGTVGYHLIERWSLFDGLYMTVITIASVGFMEVHDLSPQGRLFTIFLILCGSATLIYGLSAFTAFIVEGELSDALRRRKMKHAIDRLENHYIVCGVSATGRYIIDELAKTGRRFLVIDRDPEKLKPLAEAGILHLLGDATHEAVLAEANLSRAAGLFTALHHDADNLITVVTAKGLRPDLTVVAKAIDEESERKLRQVGADRVVMPNFIGGLRMASEMIRPSVVSFLDTMLRSRDAVMRVEELRITTTSSFCGQSLGRSGLLNVENVSIVAIGSEHGEFRFNPSPHHILSAGDIIIAMGEAARLRNLYDT